MKPRGSAKATGVTAAAALALALSATAPSAWGTPVRSLLEMRQNHVVIQEWDLSCGAAALATLLNFEFGDRVSEREIARGLMERKEYIAHPLLVQIRQGFSLLDLKRYVDARGYEGIGFGKLTLEELVKRAPVLVPVNFSGYNHFVVFRGVLAGRVLFADPAWGNRTMDVKDFEKAWIDYGAIGKVGFVVERKSGAPPISRLAPRPEDFETRPSGAMLRQALPFAVGNVR